MTHTRSLPLLILLGTLALGPTLSASIAELATFDEKVENAAAIVLGTCVKSESRWDAQHRWIVTYSTFRVEKVLKGSPTIGDLTVVTPGGNVDGLYQETIGIPQFTLGDERVLFVKNTASGTTVLYFDQGTYDVRTERGEKIISPTSSKLVTISMTSGAAVTDAEPPRTLASFKGAVDQTLRVIDERRQKMGMMTAAKRKQDDSIATVLKRNWLLVGLALVGLAFATWQFTRR